MKTKKISSSEELSSQIRWTKNGIILKPVNQYRVQINSLVFTCYDFYIEKSSKWVEKPIKSFVWKIIVNN